MVRVDYSLGVGGSKSHTLNWSDTSIAVAALPFVILTQLGSPAVLGALTIARGRGMVGELSNRLCPCQCGWSARAVFWFSDTPRSVNPGSLWCLAAS